MSPVWSSRSSSVVAASPSSFVVATCLRSMPTPANRSRILPTPCTGTPASCISTRYERRGGSSEKSRRGAGGGAERGGGGAAGAGEVAGRAGERPRDHAPDGVLAGHHPARLLARGVKVRLGQAVVVRRELEHGVGRRVEDHLAG